MTVSTRTSEGIPSSCPICGKQIVVSPALIPGDAVCPHCGSLVFPLLGGHSYEGDYKKELEALGVFVEVNDEGEVVVAELHGPRFNDKTIHALARCNGIPKIKLCNTGLSSQAIEKLRELLPNSIVEVES